ncbi:MAG: PAS domain-containing sensor histidine kinase [Saprospiraceae bacterium]|nr:MAG: PAS domain-containing sensor histidine kinase [Saprospiraceae bacterium]
MKGPEWKKWFAVMKRLPSNIWRQVREAAAALGKMDWSPAAMFQRLDSLKLRTKLTAGMAVILLCFTFLGILGGYYVQRTSNNLILLLNDNYTTLQYTNIMSQAVNDFFWAVNMQGAATSLKRLELEKAFGQFELYFNLLSKKVGSDAEQKLLDELRTDYEITKNSLREMVDSGELPFDMHLKRRYILSLLQNLYDLNTSIIEKRTREANDLANRVTLYLIVAAFFFLLFASFATTYFPQYITEPIETMTESIRQIARKNYQTRLVINRRDELGTMAHSFNIMAEKLEEYESINVKQILTEKQRTETIISRMNEAIIGLDDHKRVLFVNPPALALAGMSESEIIGQPAQALAEKSEFLQNVFREVLQDQVPDNLSLPAISVDHQGKRQYYNKDLLKVQDTSDADGATNVGYIVILKNVTELKEADLAKTNFMATLSHELKTPISAIDMSLKLLEDRRIGSLNAEQKELATTIRQNTSRLLKMINEILEISKIETGKLQIQKERTDAEFLIRKALDNVKAFVFEKKLDVNQYIEPDLPTLHVDIPKTTAVLVNLLTNAVRYSPPRSSIEISVVRHNGMVEFAIKDHGPGISEEEQKKLFQPYRRAQGDKTKGTGLGLAISKEFVEAQGGKIWMESQPGKGSVFGFNIPLTDH